MNKILVEIYVPTMEEKYDVFIPINKTIETVLILLNKAISDITNGKYIYKNTSMLCNKDNGQVYELNKLVKDVGLKNGSKLLLI